MTVPGKGGARKGSLHHKAKLTEADVIEIRRRRHAGHTLDEIWADYPDLDSYSVLARAARGATWKHLPGEFRDGRVRHGNMYKRPKVRLP